MSMAAPATTRYRPEEILVCKSADVPANLEWTVDAWRRIAPNFAVFNWFATENGADVHDARIRVSVDGRNNVYDEHADACLPLSQSQLAGVFAHRLMTVRIANTSALAISDYQFRYRYLVDNWTIAERIRRGALKTEKGVPSGKWTSEELRIEKKFNLIHNVLAGKLPYEFPWTRTGRLFKETVIEIQEIARCMDTIPANSVANPDTQVDVGPRITVPGDEKVILFEIATEQPHEAADQTFIVVDRELDQPDYMLWNTWCFAGIDHPERLWVPALEEFYIHARSVVAQEDFKIRYKYARCKLTLIEKIRWNIDMDASEVAICDSLDLWDRVVAGVVHKSVPS